MSYSFWRRLVLVSAAPILIGSLAIGNLTANEGVQAKPSDVSDSRDLTGDMAAASPQADVEVAPVATLVPPTVAPPPPPPTAARPTQQPSRYLPGNAYNCSDFGSYAQAKAYLDAVPGDPSKLDADHDGKPCETLR